MSIFPPVAIIIILSLFIFSLWNKAAARAAAPPGSKTSFNLINAKLIIGNVSEITTGLQKALSSEYEISPQVYLLNELKLVDFSGLTSKSHIIDAIKKELEEFSNACVIIEAK